MRIFYNDIAAINFTSNMHDQRFVRDMKDRWKKYRPCTKLAMFAFFHENHLYNTC